MLHRQMIFFIALVFQFDDQIAFPIFISAQHPCAYRLKYKVFIYKDKNFG